MLDINQRINLGGNSNIGHPHLAAAPLVIRFPTLQRTRIPETKEDEVIKREVGKFVKVMDVRECVSSLQRQPLPRS